MCYLYRQECEDFLASHFDFLHSLESNDDKRFNGLFLGCGTNVDLLSKVVHKPLAWCWHKVEDQYYGEIEYIDSHWPSLNSIAIVDAWKKNNDIQASVIAALLGWGDAEAARAWRSSTEKCKRFCNKEECKCIRDMIVINGTVAWKRRYKFIA